MSEKRSIRCAIYTRKSSEEGLEQEFNSLDAQREACEAYVASQRHEGWRLIKERFDDGGLSGGTLERPALQCLLDDMDSGKIDMIVVYKIDRLTRSLADFARLAEKFEARQCSFVSVTQSFNTSTSMGRLTLNVLLSFAQFERELTSERIRDKFASSKKKGIWMGGMVPLGYDAKDQKLHINAGEAKTVRAIYDLYLQHNSITLVKEDADRLGLTTKRHVFASGKVFGGNPFSRGRIHHLLMNPIYAGMVRHNRTLWPGRHEAIIDLEMWEKVQAVLSDGAARKRRLGPRTRKPEPVRHRSPLAGKLFDETGERLTPTHSRTGGSRLRYYVSARLLQKRRTDDTSGWRLPAEPLESFVANKIADRMLDHSRASRLFCNAALSLNSDANKQVEALSIALRKSHDLLEDLVARIELGSGKVAIRASREALAKHLKVDPPEIEQTVVLLDVPFQIRRRGVEARIVSGEYENSPDPTILRMIARARGWRERILAGERFAKIAESEKVTSVFVRTRMELAFLSPRIVEALLDGKQPVELTLEKLVRTKLPLDWAQQEQLLGFA